MPVPRISQPHGSDSSRQEFGAVVLSAMNTVLVTPQLKGRPRSDSPIMIVMHATAGSDVAGAVSTLRERGLSYNYIIAKDGTVYKCLPLSMVAFHAGNSYGPKEAQNNVSRRQNFAGEFTATPIPCVNGYTVGISFVNLDDGEDPFTAAQENSARELIRAVKTQYPEIIYLTSHAFVSPRRKVDPLGYDLKSLAHDSELMLWKFGGMS